MSKLDGKAWNLKEQEPERFQQIQNAKEEFLHLETLDKKAKQFLKIKKHKEQLEEKLSAVNLRIEGISALMLEQLEEDELSSVRLPSGVTVFKRHEVYPKVLDKAELFQWIKRTKQVSLLSVHHQTLKGLCRERLENGESLPTGVDAFIKTSLGHRTGGASE